MRLLAKLLGAVIPLSLLICAPVQARDWSVIQKSGTIIAATEGAFAPFNYYEGTKLTGYEVDVGEALAKKLGLKIEWKAVPFDAQLAAVKQDRFDFAIASHGYTKERAKAVDFASPHYCTGGMIAAAKDGSLTVDSLKGKTVGVQLATSYFDAAKKIPGVKEVKPTRPIRTHLPRSRPKRLTPGFPTNLRSWKLSAKTQMPASLPASKFLSNASR